MLSYFQSCLIFQKTNKKIWQISAQESKMWSNQQNKGTFLWYHSLQIILWAIFKLKYIIECLYLVIWLLFRFFGRNSSNSEINWPLIQLHMHVSYLELSNWFSSNWVVEENLWQASKQQFECWKNKLPKLWNQLMTKM